MRSAGRFVSGILSVSLAAVLVTALPATPGQAAPRPAGRILVVDDQTGQGVFSVRAAGGGVRSLHLTLPVYGYPDYSPDGSRVAFGEAGTLYTVDANGDDRRWVIEGPSGAEYPRWAPYGTEIGYTSGTIYAANVAVPGQRQILGLDGSGRFDWSPDGRLMAGLRHWSIGGDPWDPIYAADIWIAPADGTEVSHRLTYREGTWAPSGLAWSPDGRTLAVEVSGDLWAVNARTGAATNLTSTPAIAESSPIWSPDGRLLAFAREVGDGTPPQVWLRPALSRGATGWPLGVTGVPSSWH
jgi:TolB protein